MPRGPRCIAPEGTFHLIARGNNGEVLCKFPRDFRALKYRIASYFDTIGTKIYHFCLMQTHFHLLAHIPDTSRLPAAIQALQVSYFYHFKRHYGYQGHLWHSRYRAIPIIQEAHLLQCARYIELNPIYAGIVAHPEEHEWTSYHHYTGRHIDPMVTLNPALSQENGSRLLDHTQYTAYIMEGCDMDYQRLKHEFERGS